MGEGRWFQTASSVAAWGEESIRQRHSAHGAIIAA
jgi:hypothetical protein